MTGFDRIRPRVPSSTGRPTEVRRADTDGKRSLFSSEVSVPSLAGVTIECSRCSATSVLTLKQAARVMLPSFHVPVVHGADASFMRCPACRKWSWVKARVRL